MGRAPCCDKANVKKGPWSPEEDAKLKDYIEKHGTGENWIALPHKAGLRRCGKSCRLRWLNYLRPNIKHGEFSEEEDKIICSLYVSIGSRWSIIAAQLQGRTDNDIKNYWNTKLKKKLMSGTIALPQRKIQGATFKSSASSLSTSTLSFKDRKNDTFNHLETFQTCPISISFSSSLVCCRPSSPANSVIQESYGGDFPNYQVKDNRFMFGVHEPSSSSDGSCSNQIGQGQGAEYEYAACGGGSKVEQMNVQNYLKRGIRESQEFMYLDGCTDRRNGLWRENPAEYEYGLEEIKQLLSTNSCNTFMFDESKTGESGL